MLTQIIRIPCEYLSDEEDLSALQARFSREFLAGKTLPEGVEVLSIEDILRELNDSDPEYYFKTLLSE